MLTISPQELVRIDQQLDPLLARASTQVVQAQQLALDATRLLSCTEGRLREYQKAGFFKRCWFGLSGKTGSLERANQNDLAEMQGISWRYLQLLQERDLMLAHSMITVRNNLLTLAIQEEDTRRAITDMASRIHNRFVSLESRVGTLEVASQIHSWLLTLDTFDYDERFPPNVRLLKVVRDFHAIKGGNWNLQELKYLQAAVGKVKLEPKKRLTLQVFIDELIDEIEQVTFDRYNSLVRLPRNGDEQTIPSAFVLENVAVPSFTALYRIAEDYSGSSATIAVLADQLKISPKEALKKALLTFITKEGIDTSIAIPLRDLAVELLTCMGLTVALHKQSCHGKDQPETATPGTPPPQPVPLRQSGDVKDQPETATPGTPPPWISKELLIKAEGGDRDAQDQLAKLIFDALDELDEDDKDGAAFGVNWLKKSAEQGHTEAQCVLGLLYASGSCVDEDQVEAAKWFRKAAEQGHAEAQLYLGHLYSGGSGVDEDQVEAAKWFRKAAEQGNAGAQLRLGYAYSSGMGVDEDKAKAAKWFRKAAEQGNVMAQKCLGDHYWGEDNITPDNEDESKKWYGAFVKNAAPAKVDFEVSVEWGILCDDIRITNSSEEDWGDLFLEITLKRRKTSKVEFYKVFEVPAIESGGEYLFSDVMSISSGSDEEIITTARLFRLHS